MAKACPECKSRATKMLSISTGMTSCQICGASWGLKPTKEQVDYWNRSRSKIAAAQLIANDAFRRGDYKKAWEHVEQIYIEAMKLRSFAAIGMTS